jgi:hypothetical protein
MRTILTNNQNKKTKLRQAAAFIIALLVANLFFVNKGSGQAASATWNLTSNGSVSSSSGNITAGTQTFAGAITTGYDPTGGANASSWGTSIDPTKYFQFTVAPTSGNNLTITSLSFFYYSVSSPMTVRIEYSLNGFATAGTQIGTNLSTTGTSTQYTSPTLSIAVNNGQTLTVRIFGAAANTFRTLYIRSFVLSGTTAANCGTITASATKNDVTCFNTSTGVITITGSGGTAPYKFSIDNITNYNATVVPGASYVPINANSGKFINLPIGTYKIRVQDNNGCESKSVQ